MTKRVGKIFDVKNIFFLCFGLLLVVSYTANPLLISDKDLFHGFERQPEGLVVGRLIKAQADGIMSDGGLTGINYDKGDSLTEERYTEYQAMQHGIYITERETPNGFYAYKSQSGGQAIAMALIGKILPVSNLHKLIVFRLLNALLIAIVFLLFAMWVSRNFGFLSSVITLICILFSPWLNVYSHSLWWVLWNFYLPMITVLLVCEYNYHKSKPICNARLFLFTLVSVFLKCWFTGFEFITTTLIAAFVPFVYYNFVIKTSFLRFVMSGFVLGMSMIIGAVLQMVVLIFQIEAYTNVPNSGLQHIIISYTKRTSTDVVDLWDVIILYFKNDFLQLGFLPNHSSFYFGLLLIFMLVLALYLLFIKNEDNRLKALTISFLFSFSAPLSWLIIFKQHAWIHPHMDYIVWYIPTILYGYVVIGVGIQHLFELIYQKRIKKEV